MYLGDEPGNQLRVRARIWRVDWAVVEFGITQIRRAHGRWLQVAKIDTCWGMVHRHLYDRLTGEDRLDHQQLEEIPAVDGCEVVTRWYGEALTMMENEWEDNLPGWNGDGS